MPEYLSPRVYVEEVDTGAKPIEGTSTSTTGMVGVTERGPVKVPILLTNPGDYARWFGGLLDLKVFKSHAFLPYAVDGFFRNNGRRLWLRRVEAGSATKAELELFDRPGAASAPDTVLLRDAVRGTGTSATLPGLYLLDGPSGLSTGDRLRIGDGSLVEFQEVDTIIATTKHGALDLPLSYAHAQGEQVHVFARPAPATSGTLAAAAAAGSMGLTVTGALTVNPGEFIEIGLPIAAEYRRVSKVDAIGTAQLLTLDRPITTAAPATTAVGHIVPAAGVTANLDAPARGGDVLVYVDNPAAFTANELVRFGATTPATDEIRRVGDARQLTLAVGGYEPYPAGSSLREVTLGDDAAQLTAATAVGDTLLPVDRVRGFVPGMQVAIDTGGSAETGTIVSADTTANTLGVTPALAKVHGIGASVTPPARVTTVIAQAGASAVALDNRLGLEPGDVLELGIAPNGELATVLALQGARGPAPDLGIVLLERPLGLERAPGSSVARRRPAPAAGSGHATLLLGTGEGATSLLASDSFGLAAGDIVEVTLPSGSVYHHALANVAALAPSVVELQSPLLRTHAAGATIGERDPLLQVEALDSGAWGNRLLVSAEDETEGLAAHARITDVVAATQIRLSTLTGVEPGTVIEFTDPGSGAVARAKVQATALGSNNLVTLDPPGLSAAEQGAAQAAIMGGTPLVAGSREFRLTVRLRRPDDPAVPSRGEQILSTETFRNLSMDPRHSRYVERVVGFVSGPPRLSDQRPEGESDYIRVADLRPVAQRERIELGPEPLTDTLPSGTVRAARLPLIGGDDALGTLSDADYVGIDDRDPLNRTGIFSLKNIDDISIVACPGQAAERVQQALIEHCEEMRYRFAVLDGPPPPNDAIADVLAARQRYDTKYAALYYPWVTIPDPLPGNLAAITQVAIPSSGHVAGIYARTDIERGVHKAPANEVIRAITGLGRYLNYSEQDILNPFPVNINVHRDFRPDGRGFRVWGARVITSDPDLKYVPVRRLLLFIEKSIDRGLQWVVFEPNAEPLWARVTFAIRSFLETVRRNGALEGTTPEQAYFVICDRTTMTQADIDNGRLICVVGVAPVKPAEFVIIRIGLKTATAEE